MTTSGATINPIETDELDKRPPFNEMPVSTVTMASRFGSVQEAASFSETRP